MGRSYTNRAQKWQGETVPMTVRVPKPLADYIDANFGPNMRNRGEYLQHWAAVGKLVSESDELSDALDWALDELTPTILDAPMEPVSELSEIRSDQLEALRSRVH